MKSRVPSYLQQLWLPGSGWGLLGLRFCVNQGVRLLRGGGGWCHHHHHHRIIIIDHRRRRHRHHHHVRSWINCQRNRACQEHDPRYSCIFDTLMSESCTDDDDDVYDKANHTTPHHSRGEGSHSKQTQTPNHTTPPQGGTGKPQYKGGGGGGVGGAWDPMWSRPGRPTQRYTEGDHPLSRPCKRLGP